MPVGCIRSLTAAKEERERKKERKEGRKERNRQQREEACRGRSGNGRRRRRADVRTQSSRRNGINSRSDLSHHRTCRSAYGGSLINL